MIISPEAYAFAKIVKASEVIPRNRLRKRMRELHWDTIETTSTDVKLTDLDIMIQAACVGWTVGIKTMTELDRNTFKEIRKFRIAYDDGLCKVIKKRNIHTNVIATNYFNDAAYAHLSHALDMLLVYQCAILRHLDYSDMCTGTSQYIEEFDAAADFIEFILREILLWMDDCIKTCCVSKGYDSTKPLCKDNEVPWIFADRPQLIVQDRSEPEWTSIRWLK